MRVFGLLAALLALVVGGWSALWFYAAGRAERGFDAWIAAQAAQDQVWTCPGRRTGGFPFAITIDCDAPTFAGRVLEEEASGSLGHLGVRVAVGDIHRVGLTLAPPLAYRSAAGDTDLTAQWSSLGLTLTGLPERLDAGALVGADLTLRGRAGGADLGTLHAGGGSLTLASVPGAPDAADFTLALAGAGVPPLDALLGDRQPTDVDLAGRLTGAVFVNAPTAADLLEQWRRAGGTLTFGTARLTRGATAMAASGPLHLDPQHRIAGHLDTRLTGLDPVLRRYGINPNIVTAGAVLNSLFGGGRDKAGAGDPNTVRLPLALRDGRVGIGPITTPIALPPLY